MKAYRCDDVNCECQKDDNFFRHCPFCGELYLWDEDEPEMLCETCEQQDDKGGLCEF